MTITVRPNGIDSNGVKQYLASGTTAGHKVCLFFGMMFIVFGLMSLAVGSIAGIIICGIIGNLIIFAANRRNKSLRQKAINEFAAKETQSTKFVQGWD